MVRQPHKVRYYLERRDPDFAPKMAEVLCVYREVKLPKKKPPSDAVAIVSYDEKPGVQALGTTTPDSPPEPGLHQTFARDHEYKRHGIINFLAGIDLLTGKVHALVENRHRSLEFVEFLAQTGPRLIDAATRPQERAIRSRVQATCGAAARQARSAIARRLISTTASLSRVVAVNGPRRRIIVSPVMPCALRGASCIGVDQPA
jgi:hypothetical protein